MVSNPVTKGRSEAEKVLTHREREILKVVRHKGEA